MDGLDCANETNCFFPPPGGNCSFPPGAPPSPCPGLPPGLNTSPGQSDVTLDNQTALGTDCSFSCLKAQAVAQSTSGQTAATHNEASAGEEAASLALDITGSIKSVIELITGTDAVTGEEVSRIGSAAGIALGIAPGGKALVKGKKAQRLAKRLAKKEKNVLPKSTASGPSLSQSTKTQVIMIQVIRDQIRTILERVHFLKIMKNYGRIASQLVMKTAGRK